MAEKSSRTIVCGSGSNKWLLMLNRKLEKKYKDKVLRGRIIGGKNYTIEVELKDGRIVKCSKADQKYDFIKFHEKPKIGAKVLVDIRDPKKPQLLQYFLQD